MKQAPDLNEGIKHRDPFVVPEGYFDTLADSVMQRIDTEVVSTQEAKPTGRSSRVWRLVRWSAAACIVAVAGFGISRLGSDESGATTNDNLSQYTTIESDEEWDEAVDYALVNNMDIAYLLTEAY